MNKKIIISGGGTGGHIFPAVSIAGEIKKREPDTEILFVGANGGMEMDVVPRYGYEIEGVWISGIQRQLTIRNIFRNLFFPIKLLSSLMQSRKIIRRFGPQAVIGVGGYASGPLGRVASGKKIPLFLCEANAFPGLVNRWLAKWATKILLGNGDADKYFDASRTVVTGNPIRTFPRIDRAEAGERMGINPDRKTILSLGGSLGALSINRALLAQIETIMDSDVQLIWQCGKRYYESLKTQVPYHPNVHLMPFIEDMAAAYSLADLVISRAGGSTISELIALEKPSILVPSPNVAEDHQTKNARSLSDKDAAILVEDKYTEEKLLPEAIRIVRDEAGLETLQQGIAKMEKHDAAKEIVDEIYASMQWT
ncbi:MAG: undecaprenyldiphospho-muramoylpentapeptide beta-N-acetylglucosaminyltransferase [Bacteroidota bacterium]